MTTSPSANRAAGAWRAAGAGRTAGIHQEGVIQHEQHEARPGELPPEYRPLLGAAPALPGAAPVLLGAPAP
ncbi:MAG: hypothetical protein IT305_14825 [Chloroflexi bacterium]|nr:hypothetical protein [Chloroflexota bacterium]